MPDDEENLTVHEAKEQSQDQSSTISQRLRFKEESASSATDSRLQPLMHLEPPPQIRKPKRGFIHDVKLGGLPSFFTHAGWKAHNICVRSVYCARPPPATPVHTLRILPEDDSDDVQPPHGVQKKKKKKKSVVKWDGNPYVVIGLMGKYHPVVRERLIEVAKPESLFQQMRSGIGHIRPFYRRILSLKRVNGFQIYKCNALKGYHTPVEIDHETQVILTQLFRDYESGEPDYGDRWLDWIQKEFNMHEHSPADGKYALKLVLRWSPPKFVMYGNSLIILSLAVGFWYMWGVRVEGASPSDNVAITQTAWTISSFILTAASVALALLAALTQIGDV